MIFRFVNNVWSNHSLTLEEVYGPCPLVSTTRNFKWQWTAVEVLLVFCPLVSMHFFARYAELTVKILQRGIVLVKYSLVRCLIKVTCCSSACAVLSLGLRVKLTRKVMCMLCWCSRLLEFLVSYKDLRRLFFFQRVLSMLWQPGKCGLLFTPCLGCFILSSALCFLCFFCVLWRPTA